MEQYRKKDVMSDIELESFKQIEIDKIRTSINNKVDNKRNLKRMFPISLSVSLASILIVIIAITIGNSSQQSPNYLFKITKVSASEYMVEYESDDQRFYFYYKAFVVYENDTIPYDDQFDYNMRYDYVPEDILSQVEIEFDAFRLDDYRYFLESSINGETRYTEVDFYPALIKDKAIEGLDIIDFENDMKDIYDLIEKYPPVFYDTNEYGTPIYAINSGINEIEDQRRVSNYSQYVENYYEQENFYGEAEGSEVITYMIDNLIVLDSSNVIEKNYYNTHLYSGSHISPDEVVDLVDYSFSFYSKGEKYPVVGGAWYLKGYSSDVNGKITNFQYNGNRYVFIVIDVDESNIDFSSVSEVKYIYRLHGIYDFNKTLREVSNEVFIHEGNLVVAPLVVAEEDDDRMVSLFSYFEIEFYDQEGTLIYELVVLDQYN